MSKPDYRVQKGTNMERKLSKKPSRPQLNCMRQRLWPYFSYAILRKPELIARCLPAKALSSLIKREQALGALGYFCFCLILLGYLIIIVLQSWLIVVRTNQSHLFWLRRSHPATFHNTDPVATAGADSGFRHRRQRRLGAGRNAELRISQAHQGRP